jgi:hypothetical protein
MEKAKVELKPFGPHILPRFRPPPIRTSRVYFPWACIKIELSVAQRMIRCGICFDDERCGGGLLVE